MPVAVVAGIELRMASLTEREAIRAGDRSRSFSNTLRSTVWSEKRAWDGEVVEMAQVDFNTLKTAIANGAHVTCSGDAFGGSVTCEVTLRGTPYVRQGNTGFLRVPSMTIEEV